MLTIAPVAEGARPVAKVIPLRRWRAPGAGREGTLQAASEVPSVEALLRELASAISSGCRFVAVGKLPRWVGRRRFDARMRRQERLPRSLLGASRWRPAREPGIRYCRSGRLFWLCSEFPFAAPDGATALDASRDRIRLGNYWIETRRQSRRWLTRIRIDAASAARLGAHAS